PSASAPARRPRCRRRVDAREAPDVACFPVPHRESIMHTKPNAVLLVTSIFLASAVHAQQQTCFPSKHGKDDQVGNLNYVTAEKTLAATKLVTKGKSYRLGIETNKDTPAFPPRTWSIAIVQPG